MNKDLEEVPPERMQLAEIPPEQPPTGPKTLEQL
ncbi:unnamed protein product [Anisakis simplex]|uniref:Uncharacterized protein n=1 Tax=Anisakis simplex TaxID=6269 RepID=A0A3P6QKP3_ANISI|nr:unnamed protein product [Anisakis simplex]